MYGHRSGRSIHSLFSRHQIMTRLISTSPTSNSLTACLLSTSPTSPPTSHLPSLPAVRCLLHEIVPLGAQEEGLPGEELRQGLREEASRARLHSSQRCDPTRRRRRSKTWTWSLREPQEMVGHYPKKYVVMDSILKGHAQGVEPTTLEKWNQRPERAAKTGGRQEMRPELSREPEHSPWLCLKSAASFHASPSFLGAEKKEVSLRKIGLAAPPLRPPKLECGKIFLPGGRSKGPGRRGRRKLQKCFYNYLMWPPFCCRSLRPIQRQFPMSGCLPVYSSAKIRSVRANQICRDFSLRSSILSQDSNPCPTSDFRGLFKKVSTLSISKMVLPKSMSKNGLSTWLFLTRGGPVFGWQMGKPTGNHLVGPLILRTTHLLNMRIT